MDEIEHFTGSLIYLQGNIEGSIKIDEPITYTKVFVEKAIYNKSKNAIKFDFSGNEIYPGGYVKVWLYPDFKFLGKAYYSVDFPEEPLEGKYYYNDEGLVLIGKWLSQGIYTHFIVECKKSIHDIL